MSGSEHLVVERSRDDDPLRNSCISSLRLRSGSFSRHPALPQSHRSSSVDIERSRNGAEMTAPKRWQSGAEASGAEEPSGVGLQVEDGIDRESGDFGYGAEVDAFFFHG
jgi:hypothetical protein